MRRESKIFPSHHFYPTIYLLEVVASAIGHQREIQYRKFGKGEIKFSLFADDINIYVEGDKEVTSKSLELISKYTKICIFLYWQIKNNKKIDL